MTERAKPDDAGCWVDGHWGQYGIARSVEIAAGYGFGTTPSDGPADVSHDNDYAELEDIATRHLASMGPSGSPDISDDEFQALFDYSTTDDVDAWMTEHVAPKGYSFGWYEGEWFLWSDAQWNDDEEELEDISHDEGQECRRHGVYPCTDPECIGVPLSEVRDAELWGGTE